MAQQLVREQDRNRQTGFRPPPNRRQLPDNGLSASIQPELSDFRAVSDRRDSDLVDSRRTEDLRI